MDSSSAQPGETLEPSSPSSVTMAGTASDDSLYCPNCGYELRGITSERCPECGVAIDRTSIGVSRLPWSRRGQLGFVRAYLSTLKLSLWRPRELAAEINRPVSYADSQTFRAITILLAAIGPLGFCIFGMLSGEWMRTDEVAAAFVGVRVHPLAGFAATWMAGARLYPVIPLASCCC